MIITSTKIIGDKKKILLLKIADGTPEVLYFIFENVRIL